MPPKSKRVLPGKRYPLNMRTTKELRDKIEEAAMASGRSLCRKSNFGWSSRSGGRRTISGARRSLNRLALKSSKRC